MFENMLLISNILSIFSDDNGNTTTKILIYLNKNYF